MTVLRVREEAVPTGLVTTFREFLADPTPRVLWDLREYKLSRLANEQLRWLVSQLLRSDTEKRPTGRSAFVCSEADRNVMRILIAYAEANDYGVELAAFLDFEEARRWLEDDHAEASE